MMQFLGASLTSQLSKKKKRKERKVQTSHSMQCFMRCPHAIRHSELLDRSQFVSLLQERIQMHLCVCA